MKHALAPQSRALLRAFARSGTLLALDYDGTLAPIVADRSRAHMRDRTQALLAQVARRLPTVFITGRARRDVLRFLHGIQTMEVIGNHGLEADGAQATRYVTRVRRWRRQLEQALPAAAGVTIEDKRYSLALHYRNSPDRRAAREAALRATAALDSVRVIGGLEVVNLVPLEAANKGDALLGALARWNCERAIFIGDDDTDEDVFALRQPERLLTVRVGPAKGSAADYFLDNQSEIDDLLGVLLRSPAVTTHGLPC